MTEQIGYQDFSFGHQENDFALNPEPRCACVLVLDNSYSMSGARIDALNEGLLQLNEELNMDGLAAKRVEIAVVSFGPVDVLNSFESAQTWQPPKLVAKADTPMGAALTKAIEMVQERKSDYRANGVKYFRPWIFLITDGAPTDNWDAASQAVRQGEEQKQFAFFAVGVDGADMQVLQQISSRDPLKLEGLKFRELFAWLSSSLQSVSQSVPGEQVPLASPAGWAVV